MLKNALEFPDIIVRECMIPRNEIIAVNSNDEIKDLILTNKSILTKIEFMSTKIQRLTGVILIIFAIKLLFSIQWKSIRFNYIFWYGDRYE